MPKTMQHSEEEEVRELEDTEQEDHTLIRSSHSSTNNSDVELASDDSSTEWNDNVQENGLSLDSPSDLRTRSSHAAAIKTTATRGSGASVAEPSSIHRNIPSKPEPTFQRRVPHTNAIEGIVHKQAVDSDFAEEASDEEQGYISEEAYDYKEEDAIDDDMQQEKPVSDDENEEEQIEEVSRPRRRREPVKMNILVENQEEITHHLKTQHRDLQRYVNIINDVIEDRLMNELELVNLDRDVQAMLSECLPIFAEAILNRSDYATEAIAMNINVYFQKLINIAAYLLKNYDSYRKSFPIPEKLYMTIQRILNDDRANFYQRFDGRLERDRTMFMRDRDEEILNEDDLEGNGFDSEIDGHYSQLHMDNIIYFVGRGGLDAVVQFLEQLAMEQELDLEMVNHALDLFRQIGPLVANSQHNIVMPSNWYPCLQKITDIIKSAVLRVSDDAFRGFDRRTVLSIVTIVTSNLRAHVKTADRDDDTALSTDSDEDDAIGQNIRSFISSATFRLTIASRALRSSRLEWRLSGLADIKAILQEGSGQVQTFDRGPRISLEMESFTGGGTNRGWGETIRFLIQWLRDNKILEYIFGPNIHLEIVQRSYELLVFLVTNRALSNSDLEVIWRPIVANQHRSVVHGVFQLLAELAPLLNISQLSLLFRKLRNVSLSQLDQQMIQLIRTAIFAMLKGNQVQPLRLGAMHDTSRLSFEGYMLLFQILHESAAAQSPISASASGTPILEMPSSAIVIDPEILNVVLQTLLHALQFGPSFEDRVRLLELCLDDLRSHHPGVMWSLQIIHKIVTTLQQGSTDEVMQEKCNTVLESGNMWLDLFLDDLNYWCNLIKYGIDHQLSGSITASSSNDIGGLSSPKSPLRSESPTLISKMQLVRMGLTGDAQLNARLQFLVSTMENTNLCTWSTEQKDRVWDCLIADAIGQVERDTAFGYLLSLPNHDVFTFYFFRTRIPELDAVYFSQHAFNYLRHCFVHYNIREGALKPPSTQCSVVGELIGIDHIWNVALNCLDEYVGSQAVNFLAELLVSADTSAPEGAAFAKQQWQNMIDLCFGHLVLAAGQLAPTKFSKASDAISRKLQRCLHLLKVFLDMYEIKFPGSSDDGEASTARHGFLNDGGMITLKLKPPNAPVLEVPINIAETLLNFRRKVAAIMGARVDTIRLISNGKEYSNDGKTLKELKLVNDQLINVASRAKAEDNSEEYVIEESEQDAFEKEDLPTHFLSQPKYFDQLFDMLELDELYSQQIWELLMRLPTNTRLLYEMKSLNSPVQWTLLLHDHSPLKLLYGLDIAHFLLRREQISNSAEWKNRFLVEGGLTHLLSILMSGALDFKSGEVTTAETSSIMDNMDAVETVEVVGPQNTTAACLALLLKVVALFVVDEKASSEFINVDETALMHKLMSIIRDFTTKSVHAKEDIEIVEKAAQLLFHYFAKNRTLYSEFKAYEDLKEWFLGALLKCTSQKIRCAMSRAIAKFCAETSNWSDEVESVTKAPSTPVLFFLEKLFLYFPEVEDFWFSCKEYFELANEFIKSHYYTIASEDIPSLFIELLDRIIQHPIREATNSVKDDCMIIGLLELATLVIRGRPELKDAEEVALRQPVILLYHDCLFEIPTKDKIDGAFRPPKCKLESSRAAAFDLLYEIVNGSVQNYAQLIDKLKSQLDRGEYVQSIWNFSPQATQKSNCGYVGLQNLGATCYMNSIMQQFYMIPSFRKGIFASIIGNESEDERKDNLLYQLQTMYGNLQESEKKAYFAYSFCEAMKDYEGRSMNVNVQMDVDEYFNMLFDRLESLVSGTPQEQLFKKHFGGKLLQQIKSKDCEHVSEREESFFAIQCEVKNKRNVEESLETYVAGEVLDGDNKYACAQCGKHVDAVKRACLKQLPDNLIFNLKRFEYDLETMRRTKINDYFEFPMRINMDKYTLDYLSAKEAEGVTDAEMSSTLGTKNEYELVGVLVHTGTTDSGHYYSFIKERQPSTFGDGTKRWFHFNDSLVTQFDPNDIPSQCYGGVDTVQQWDIAHHKNVVHHHFLKPYNAYMLFYERISDHSTDEETDVKVPDDIFEMIWEDNTNFLQDKNIFDNKFFEFLWKTLHTIQGQNLTLIRHDYGDLSMKTIKVASLFFAHTLAHSKEITELQKWTDFLKQLFKDRPEGARWFFRHILPSSSKDINYIEQLLLTCFVEEVREAVVDLFVNSLRTLREYRPHDYGLEDFNDSDDREMNVDNIRVNRYCKTPGIAELLISTCIELVADAYYHWRNFDQFFMLMSEIANFGLEEVVCMIEHQYVQQLIDFYLHDESPKATKRRLRMGDKFTAPSFRFLLTTIRTLVLASDIPASIRMINERREYDEDAPGYDSPITLSNKDIELLLYTNSERQVVFFWKQIKERQELQVVKDIIRHLVSDNWALSEKMITFLYEMLDVGPPDHYYVNIFEILADLLTLKDGLANQREKKVVMVVLRMMKSKTAVPQFTLEALHFFIALCNEMDPSQQFILISNLEDLLVDLMITNPYEQIRTAAANLCTTLCIPKDNSTEHQLKNNTSLYMFDKLLKALTKATEVARGFARRSSDQGSWKLVFYIQTLRKFPKGPNERSVFQNFFGEFGTLLTTVNRNQFENDMNKKELVAFLCEMVEESPECLDLVTSSPDFYDQFHSLWINLKNDRDNIGYNNELLSNYYRVILLGCKSSENYLRVWSHAENFFWASNTMIWGRFHDDQCTLELQELAELCIRNESSRRFFWQKASVATSLQTEHESLLRFLDFVFYQSRGDVVMFFHHETPTRLTKIILNHLTTSLAQDESDIRLVQKALKTLGRYLEATFAVLPDTEAKQAMSRWRNRNDLISGLKESLAAGTISGETEILAKKLSGMLQEDSPSDNDTKSDPNVSMIISLDAENTEALLNEQ